MNDTTAILLGAGRSRRLGFDKILSPLAGRPVLSYSLEALAASPEVKEIIVVTRPDIEQQVAALAARWAGSKPWSTVAGGAERQDSVWAGLQAASRESALALIHDAARPLLTAAMVAELTAAAREKGSAVCARSATDTLKEAEADGRVIRTVDRAKFWQVETPQIFRREAITQAYQEIQGKGVMVTDDASVAEYAGLPVHLVTAGQFNLKITRAADWVLLELWLGTARGLELRRGIHDLANRLSPLVGYLPLLAKYGGQDEKFLGYMAKCGDAVQGAEAAIRQIQMLAREVFPDRRDGPPEA